MAIRMILLDLDGTLLTGKKTVSPGNYAALQKASEAGIHIVISTGRIVAGLPKAAKELPFVRYVVAVNGAQIVDVPGDKVLCREEIAPAEALQVYEVLDRYPVIYDCFMDGWGYMGAQMYAHIDDFISDPVTNQMVKDLRKPVPDFKKLVAEGDHIQKLQMFFADMDRRAEALRELPGLFPDMVVSSSIVNNIEINAKHATKGEALHFLCKYLGLDISETMAFGDSSNDLSMIQAAGVGVAMANADPVLQAAADYITDTNEADGVAKAIARFCPALGLYS